MATLGKKKPATRRNIPRRMCEKGKFKDLLEAVTTEELRQSFKPDLTQPIHYFAARGNLQAVRELVETYKCNPECQNVHGITPLHCASYCGRLSVVKWLVNKHKCEVNVRDKKGACPLAYTAYWFTKKLRRRPLDVFQEHNKPRGEHVHIAKLLLPHTVLQSGATLRFELCILRLPLFRDSFDEYEQLESSLRLKLGDNSPELCSEVANCFEIALEQSKSSFVERLSHTYSNSIKKAMKSDRKWDSAITKAFHKACSEADIDVLKVFIGDDICKPDVQSLKIAIDDNHYELVQFLLRSADHPILLDKFERRSCILSYIFDRQEHDEKLFGLVLEATVGTDVRDAEGNTPLHLLCKYPIRFRFTVATNYLVYSRYQGVINSKGELPLHIACESNDVELIKRVSSELKEEINIPDNHGNTPLHIACKFLDFSIPFFSGDTTCILDCLKYFVNEKMCDVEIQNNLGELPLHTFLRREHTTWGTNTHQNRKEVIELITSNQHYRINTQDNTRNAPLHLACKLKDSRTVLYLISKFKCDLNITNDEGCLPLHYALGSKLLFEAIVAVSNGCTKKCKQNNVGKTPLHIVCETVTKREKCKGDNEKKYLLDLLCDQDIINVQDKEGNTPLHIACMNGDLETAVYLTSKFQCDLDLLNGRHCLPLHYAVRHSSLKLVQIVSGCTLNLIHMQNIDGETPLHIACQNEFNIDVVKYLVFGKKCFPSCFKQSSDIYDSLKIHLACKDNSDIELLKLMANEHNVNNKLDYHSNTPVLVACKNDNHLAVKYLLELNCDIVLRKDSQGRLPFHIACSKSLECVKVMSPYIENDAVNNCDETGNTPLHIACKVGALDIVRYLTQSFDCGPSMRLRNKEGKLPVDYACEHPIEMVKLVSESCTVENLVLSKYTKGKHNSLDKVNLPYYSNIYSIEGFIADSHDYESDDDYYNYPKPSVKVLSLDIACRSGYLDTVMYLINEKGCTLSALKNDHSALWYACGLLPRGYGHHNTPKPDIVKFLIEKCGYDPKMTFNGTSLFHYCCEIHSVQLMKVLPIDNIDNQDDKGNTLLHYACKYDSFDIVQYLLDRGCNPNIVNGNGESPLHIACRSSLNVIKLLTNCDVNLKNADGDTPLHIACMCKATEIAHYLIEEMNCDVKVRNNEGEYPLHVACLYSIQILPESLLQKSDINCQDNYGDTPLHNACYMRDIETIQFLLSCQECRTDILNQDGELALHVFLNVSSERVYKTALSKVYQMTFYNHKQKSIKGLSQIVELILQRYPAAAITTNHDGLTPIDLAIIKIELKLIKILLEIGEVDDQTRRRLLHTACENARPEVVRWLVDYGASTDVTDEDDNFPQHICFKSEYDCLETLTQLGPVDVCKQGNNNDTILHLACRRIREDVLQYILKSLDNCKEAFSIQNFNKDTPLHLLAVSMIGSSQTIELIECSNPNIRNMSGNTALHLACKHKYELAEHLITNCKCDPNVANNKGELPLHIAIAQSQLKLTKLLASHENVNMCTKNHGDSPLHIACRAVPPNPSKSLSPYSISYLNYIQVNRPLQTDAATPLELVKLVATSENANLQNFDGDSPLHIACQGKYLDVALYLLKELKCSVELLNNKSESAFHILFKNLSYHNSSFEFQKCLLSDIPTHVKDMPNKNGDTIFHIACQKGGHDVVKYLVETLRCKVDVINEHSGATALHFACNRESDSLEVLKLVTQCDPRARIRDISYLPKGLGFVSGDTPLHIACRKGNVPVIKHLLRSGHSQILNHSNVLNEFPFHLAVAANQSIQLIKLFIQYAECFDCNAKNELNGDTILHILCMHKSSSFCVNLLVHKLKCKVNIQNEEGNLPLHIACQNTHICKDTVKVLCKVLSKDEIKHQNKNGNTALHVLLRCQHDEYKIKHFQSILQIFEHRRLLPVDGQVLDYIHLACRYQKVDVVKYLCEKYYLSQPLKMPVSVLYEACLNCNKSILKYVLETFKDDFDVNIPNEKGNLPLHLAASMKVCMESIILLVQKTENINYKNNQGETPLHVLYSGYNISSIDDNILFAFMYKECTNFSATSEEGCTPLHRMCRAGRFDDFLTVLEERSIYINGNVQDKNGVTLLHLACEANKYTTVFDLLHYSEADPSIEDKNKQTPITLTTDPDIIKLLMEYGADPQPLAVVHKEYFERFSCENPPPTPVKLLVIGYPSVGKTTLIQSLQNELSEEVISEHFDHTAGIVTTNFSSQHYGDVTFYDFAGQAEYYASHDAVLHSTIKNVPPVVIILVNLNESNKSILNQTNYWINLMANRCSGLGSEAAHMILVGSHADVLESCGGDPSEKVFKLFQSVAVQVKKKNIILKGMVHLNCTKSKSSEMSRLQELLQQSTNDLREKGVMDFNSHCFYVFLLYMFKSTNVVTLGHILTALKSKSKDVRNSPLFVLPSDRPKVIKMCHDLNEKGHIMFIEHPTIIDMSWLILDKAPLLHEILGTLFSPTDFPQHRPLSYSTGVVPLSRFDKHFSTKRSYPSTLSLSFLSRMEYCREIKDPIVLESIVKEKEFSNSEIYYFFPNLVSLKRPTDIWENTDLIAYKSGWLIQCKTEGECFSPHFIQALLLRLAFSFTPKKEEGDENDFETYDDDSSKSEDSKEENQIKQVVINRLCSVWKNGIYWMEGTGVKTVVEVIDQTTLVLLMQCFQGCEMELVKRRSSIISMVLSAKDEYCSKAELREYFLHPKVVTHPLPNVGSEDFRKHLFPFQQVVKSITKKNHCVINGQNQHIALKDLLYFEPFSELSSDVSKVKRTHNLCEELISIFNGRNPPQGIYYYIFYSYNIVCC